MVTLLCDSYERQKALINKISAEVFADCNCYWNEYILPDLLRGLWNNGLEEEPCRWICVEFNRYKTGQKLKKYRKTFVRELSSENIRYHKQYDGLLYHNVIGEVDIEAIVYAVSLFEKDKERVTEIVGDVLYDILEGYMNT